jgi:hypothetical protein
MSVFRKSGREAFYGNDIPVTTDVLQFWQWSASDLLSNATRGVVAEFMVASALGVADGVRKEWDAYDVVTKDGLRVEVKSAAYLQSWHQERFSTITFDIAPTYGWDASTNQGSKAQKRQADAYVFCLLHHKDKITADPLNMDQWEFYVVATKVLDERFGTQKSIGLNRLKKLGLSDVSFKELAGRILEIGLGTGAMSLRGERHE